MGRTKEHHLLRSMNKLAMRESPPLQRKKTISPQKKSGSFGKSKARRNAIVTQISHCISHFEEIGWTDPDVFSKERPSYTMLSSDFETPAYDINKFNP